MYYSFNPADKIIPVVVINDIDKTIPIISGLKDGGINTAEITFRTPCAAEAIALACRIFPDMNIGAGTVINETQCREAIASGAAFIVSPGFSEKVLRVCREEGVPYLPGSVTPTEIMTLLENNINVIKFFPAEANGGLKSLKALSSAFPGVKFIPTGGINPGNFPEYINSPFIRAIGGSWMIKDTYEETYRLTKEAMEALK